MGKGTPPDIGGFRYVRPLGRGGFADVFLYEMDFPKRLVAVKVLRRDMEAEARGRFADEANVMARVSAHPAIVTIHLANVAADGRPYLVMEYCPHEHMGERAKRNPLSVAEALKTGIQIAGAVESAHRLGIIHRDIKPANILVTAFRHPALTDFGISVTSGSGHSYGVSVPWAPPEQINGDQVTTAVDIYALAATVYTLLAGRSPFGGDAADQDMGLMAERVLRDPVPPIPRQDIPPQLAAVLVRAMSKSPHDRHPSVIEFARALQRVQHDLGLQVTQVEAMDDALAPREVVYEDGGQTVIVAPKGATEAPPRWARDGGLGQNPWSDSAGHDRADPLVEHHDEPPWTYPPAPVTAPPARPGPDRTHLRAEPASRGWGAATGPRRRTRQRQVTWPLLAAGAVIGVTLVGATGWVLSQQAVRAEEPPPSSSDPFGMRTTQELRDGDCLKTRTGETSGRRQTTYCQDEHYGFVVHREDLLTNRAYPGREALTEEVQGICRTQFGQYTTLGIDLEEYDLQLISPTQNSWEHAGDRTIACIVERSDGQPMYASLDAGPAPTTPAPLAPESAPGG